MPGNALVPFLTARTIHTIMNRRILHKNKHELLGGHMILACHNLEKNFGERVILKGGSFHINEYEKAALIGANGAGKSTIFKMIIGEEPYSDGQITISKGISVGYLSQHQTPDSSQTIYEAVREAKKDVLLLEEQIRSLEQKLPSLTGDELSRALDQYNSMTHMFEANDGYSIESEITGILRGLGFDDGEFHRPVSTLSGGQKTRVALGRLLLEKPDLLLLDEPTNHLDLGGVSWLENYLSQYKGSVLVISHDRYFLNRFVTKIIEIENASLICFEGNYRDFSEKKRQLMAVRQKEYINWQREVAHQQAVIEKLRSFNREKSIRRAESREKMLEKITPVDNPNVSQADMKLKLIPSVTSGQDVLTIRNLSKAFDRKLLFSKVDIDIKRGEHVAVIGENGTGKTTLLKIINELIPADTGTITIGSNVEIGYYDQEHHVLDDRKTLFQEISDAYPHMTQTQIRSTLAAFCFFGDDVFKLISQLSGGEKGRLSLAKLMLSKANLLIMDEPTNHLDIESKEILERALKDYEGTVLYVSHDRYFINETATRILELTEGSFVSYIGNYDYYTEKKEQAKSALQSLPVSSPGSGQSKDLPASDDMSGKLSWQEQKELQAAVRKLKNDLQKTEAEIERLETENEEIDRQLTLEEVYSNPEKCRELVGKKEHNEEQLTSLYEKWDQLTDRLSENE